MKKMVLTIIYFAFIFSATAQYKDYLDASTCPFKFEDSEVIINSTEYNHPKISPDGTKVIVTKKRYDGIYLIDLEKGNQIQKISDDSFVGYKMEWHDNEKIRYTQNVKQKSGEGFKEYLTYNINTKSLTRESYLKTKSGERELQIIRDVKTKTIKATDGNKTWGIVSEPGTYFSLIISPDKSKVLVHKNDGRMYIYATNGSGLISCIGHGLCKNWSSDSNYLLYFIDYDDGNVTNDSDLYIATVDGSKKWKITNTTDKIEMWPHWSANKNIIVFKELKSGKIYKTNFTKN
ncbi:MAG: hypothetical protein PF485_09405 [Bacteroidales bacterium]|jgi:DNA-binding beta-propeller fold protein YncE|nr:hypothetical protein [Bacteroidales bacterium]